MSVTVYVNNHRANCEVICFDTPKEAENWCKENPPQDGCASDAFTIGRHNIWDGDKCTKVTVVQGKVNFQRNC